MTEPRPRDSNMELCRIVAMMLVLVVHADFRALPVPEAADWASRPVSAAMQFLVEALAVPAVNVFVLLSGWYGIRPRVSRFAEIVFQVLFFGLLAVGFCRVFYPAALADGHVWQRLLMLGEGDYWFVKTYLALYIISPVLNAFVERAAARQLALLLGAFFAFEWLYGWLFDATRWLVAGYSLPSFAALYLLAAGVKRHVDYKRFAAGHYFAAYPVMASLLAAAVIAARFAGFKAGNLFAYSCPVVMAMALCLLLAFVRLNLGHRRAVNWIAASALAAYLTQSSSFVGCLYDNFVYSSFNNLPGFQFILYMCGFIPAVFLGSVLIDKVRLLLWHGVLRLSKRVFER